MNDYSTIQRIIQEVISEKEVREITEMCGYKDTGRKLTVYHFFQYLLGAAIMEVSSYRELCCLKNLLGLPEINYSTFSKKAAEIPFEIYAEVCRRVLSRLNRQKRRALNPQFQRILSVVDSTRIIEKDNRFQWAMYREDQSGVKFHVSFQPDTGMPTMVIPTEINTGDSTMLEKHYDREVCLLADRGYLNVAKMCLMDETGQEFAIRIRNDMKLNKCIPFPNLFPEESKEYTDVLCCIGNDHSIPAHCRKHQFRVVSFQDTKGEGVRICTNIQDLSGREIAALYKLRWKIETFFRELKQNFTIKKMFGSSKNAVFSQGLIAFIAYAFLYDCYTSKKVIFSEKTCRYYTFLHFLRSLRYFCPGVRLF